MGVVTTRCRTFECGETTSSRITRRVRSHGDHPAGRRATTRPSDGLQH
jgi:hypothetical protein